MLDSLAQETLDNEVERRRARAPRKGPGFRVVANPQNPPAPWNDMNAQLELIIRPEVRARLGLKQKPVLGLEPRPPRLVTLRLDPSNLAEKRELSPPNP